MSFHLVMMHVKLAVGQWTLNMAVTALAAAVVLRIRRCRVRVERLPAAAAAETAAAEPDAGEPESVPDDAEAGDPDALPC